MVSLSFSAKDPSWPLAVPVSSLVLLGLSAWFVCLVTRLVVCRTCFFACPARFVRQVALLASCRAHFFLSRSVRLPGRLPHLFFRLSGPVCPPGCSSGRPLHPFFGQAVVSVAVLPVRVSVWLPSSAVFRAVGNGKPLQMAYCVPNPHLQGGVRNTFLPLRPISVPDHSGNEPD